MLSEHHLFFILSTYVQYRHLSTRTHRQAASFIPQQYRISTEPPSTYVSSSSYNSIHFLRNTVAAVSFVPSSSSPNVLTAHVMTVRRVACVWEFYTKGIAIVEVAHRIRISLGIRSRPAWLVYALVYCSYCILSDKASSSSETSRNAINKCIGIALSRRFQKALEGSPAVFQCLCGNVLFHPLRHNIEHMLPSRYATSFRRQATNLKCGIALLLF